MIGLGGAVFLALVLFSVSRQVCLDALWRYRVVVPVCPDGEAHPAVRIEAPALRRGSEGDVFVSALLRYATGSVDGVLEAPLRRFDVSLALVSGDEVTPLMPTEGWQRQADRRQRGRFAIPADLPDGNHGLRATVTTSEGKTYTLDAPLKLYAPARVHVITDRPLYEPGNTVRFRAVVLRARDLAPLDGRPGRWIVEDPTGQVVLEEEAPAGAFGVVAGELPLDAGAPVGDWRVRWESAGAQAEVTVRVEPFTLPRFVVEAAPVKGYYLPGDVPVLRGRVLYSSGAPVEADVALTWRIAGGWPVPSSWERHALPREASTGQGGWFELSLPEVPSDLRDKVTLFVTATATDPTGDSATGQGAVLLSQHAIDVEAVTELDGGLMEGFNNRLYLRATSAGGDVLARVQLEVKRAWDPADEGVVVDTDEDGVAALQMDPGPAVNVVIPPMPVRAPPPPAPVERTSVRELITGGDPSLADVREMDRWNAGLSSCARFVPEEESVQVTVRVEASGAVSGVLFEGPAEECVATVLKHKRLPAGRSRLFDIGYRLRGDMARVDVQAGGTQALPAEVSEAVRVASLDARSCLPDEIDEASLPRMVLWRVKGGRFDATFERDPDVRAPLAAARALCVEASVASALRPRTLRRAGEEQPRDAFGWVRFVVRPAPRMVARKPQATTMLGYELHITARADDERIGETTLRLSPGHVPSLRLRATPPLPKAGSDVVVDLLRGPAFDGVLPETLSLRHEQRTLEAPVDEKTRSARFTLPGDLYGWFEVQHAGARAQVYVRPATELHVSVTPAAPSYEPGATARLDVVTTAGGAGTRAAVGLFGVDETLAVLASLPGPDDMASIRPSATMSRVAFNALHVNALMQGRIRGEHAAAATVLLVTQVPPPAELDSFVSVIEETPFDPIEPLTDHFYTVLTELHGQVRTWETTAPAADQMTPQRMAQLWDASLAACRARGDDVGDAFGRPLQLSRLPDDLLALVDPRAVVVEGTRLPEDIESWPDWVRRSQP